MNAKEIRKLVIDTGIGLALKPEQIILLNVAVNLAYNAGWLDAKKAFKSDIDIALEQGASLDDLPVK